MKKENEIVIFEAADKSMTLPVSVKSDTVWLGANQMAELFERNEKIIRKHFCRRESRKREQHVKNAC